MEMDGFHGHDQSTSCIHYHNRTATTKQTNNRIPRYFLLLSLRAYVSSYTFYIYIFFLFYDSFG